MAQTITKTLIIRLVMIIACVNITIGAVFYYFSNRWAHAEFKSAIQLEVEQLSDIFTQQLWLFDLRTSEQLALMALNHPDIRGIRLSDQKGESVIDRALPNASKGAIAKRELVHQSGVLVGELEVDYLNSNKNQQEGLILKITIITVAVTLIITIFFIVYTLRKHLSLPLKKLQNDMRLVARGTFQQSYLEGEKKEIQAIINDFNHMSEALRMRENEQKKMEAELRQGHKMEALGTMAGGIAHDFNNLLAIIIGNLELLKRKLRSGGDSTKHIGNIEVATGRATKLVSQILAFSRSAEPQLNDVDFKELISNTMTLLRSTIPATIEIQSVLTDTPTWVRADQTLLQQVLMNLCTNAVHAMDERGQLEISLDLGLLPQALRKDDVDDPNDYAILSVKDTGCGMDKETLSKIFDPFFTTKEVRKGTGMGLSMVHGIISQHSGFITVDSTPLIGSEFTVYIPATTENSPEKSENKEVDTLLGGKENILLVDDEKEIIEVNTELLKGLGYNVTSVTSSKEALNTFREQSKEFDLVITDQTMPKLSGAVLAEKLIKIEPEIPIILATGYSAKVSEEEAKKIGIRAYLLKPISNELLARTVREILDN